MPYTETYRDRAGVHASFRLTLLRQGSGYLVFHIYRGPNHVETISPQSLTVMIPWVQCERNLVMIIQEFALKDQIRVLMYRAREYE